MSEQEIDTAAIRAEHQPRPDCCTTHADTDRRYCAMDGQWWPCDAVRLAAALDTARATLEDRTEAWVAELHRHGETQAHLATALRAARAEGEAR